MKTKPLVYFAIALFALLPWPALATSCNDICNDAGFDGSSCQGTAPFCSGDCDSVWNGSRSWDNVEGKGVVYKGSCTDGSSCWTGSKACCCRETLDCESACETQYGAGWDFSCMPASSAVTISFEYAFVGWCDQDYMCICIDYAASYPTGGSQ